MHAWIAIVALVARAPKKEFDEESSQRFGEYHPAGPNDTRDGRAANRRTEIVLVPRLN